MIAGRPAPRWGAVVFSYLTASLAAGAVLSAIENLPNILAGGVGAAGIANALVSCLVYGAVAGLNGVIPAALIGLVFWWFRIGSLAAWVVAAGIAAAALVLAGFSINDIELIPAALAGGFVFWACMRLAGEPAA